MFKETFYVFNSLKTFPSFLVTSKQNTTYFAFFPDFSHLLCDSDHSANAHTKPFKPWEAKAVWACLSHAEGLIWRKLFLQSVRSEPIFYESLLNLTGTVYYWSVIVGSFSVVSNSAKRDANGFFKALLLSSHLLNSRHPVRKAKFGTCAVTGYCALNVTRVAQQYRGAYFELSLVFLLIAEKKKVRWS